MAERRPNILVGGDRRRISLIKPTHKEALMAHNLSHFTFTMRNLKADNGRLPHTSTVASEL